MPYSENCSRAWRALGECGRKGGREEPEPHLLKDLRVLHKGASHGQICSLVLGGPWMWVGGRKEGDQSGGSGDADFADFSGSKHSGACDGCSVGLWEKVAPEKGLEHLCILWSTDWGKTVGVRGQVVTHV